MHIADFFFFIIILLLLFAMLKSNFEIEVREEWEVKE